MFWNALINSIISFKIRSVVAILADFFEYNKLCQSEICCIRRRLGLVSGAEEDGALSAQHTLVNFHYKLLWVEEGLRGIRRLLAEVINSVRWPQLDHSFNYALCAVTGQTTRNVLQTSPHLETRLTRITHSN